MKQAFHVAAPALASLAVGLFISLSASVLPSCKKDEPPPPLPSAAPAAAAPTPSAPLELAPEEPAAVDAGVDAGKKPTGGGSPAPSMARCCQALLQNAESAPEPNKTYLKTAGGICNGMVAAGRSGPGVLGAVQAALQGAGLPSACR